MVKNKLQVQNIAHAKCVFRTMRSYDFTLSKEECELFLPKLKCLIQLIAIIDKNGRGSDSSRGDIIKNEPPLSNIMTLQSFLGCDKYYRNYIPSTYELNTPLNNLLKKDSKLNW